MRLAISNIAWKASEDDAVAEVMRRAGADAVELAPTVYWKDPLAAARSDRVALRDAWAARGLPVAALQSLLFGFPDLNLFDASTRGAMLDRLRGMLAVAADLGAGPLVFGSPRNRRRGDLTWAAALEVAVPFFRELGDEAARLGVCLCVEPNPPAYGCDFVTTAAEGRELVERVGASGFRLHLDAAGLLLAGDEPAVEMARSVHLLSHVHFSAPQLGPVGPGSAVDYTAVAAALRAAGYGGVVSIEMRPAPGLEETLRAVDAAIRTVREAIDART